MSKSIRICLLGLAQIFVTSPSISQDFRCGTKVDTKTQQHIAELHSFVNADSFDHNSTTTTNLRVAITAHIVRKSDGSGGLTEAQLQTSLEVVNEHYASSGIEFFIFDKIRYVNSDSYYNFDSSNEDQLAMSRDVPNTINIYFVNDLTSEGSQLCGYAYFPGGADRILMANSCTITGTTFSHEIGHYLTLFHTHGRTNKETTDELVDGSNCNTAGDVICDTAADPNLSGKVDANCTYTATERDANGDVYQPDPGNIMSYSTNTCRRHFSDGQYSRARNGYLAARQYLYSKEYIAEFKPQNSIGCILDEIQFVNLSLGKYDSVHWEFDGGLPKTSEEISPLVTYSEAGIYEATLTVFGEDGGLDTRVVSKAVLINEYGTISKNSLSLDFETTENYSVFSPEDEFTFIPHQENSSTSVSLPFYDYDRIGLEDYLIFDPLEHPGSNDYILSFDYAFTYRVQGAEEFIDKVEVVSYSCGQWNKFLDLNGKEDATADPTSSPFSPSSLEWRRVKTYLPISDGAAFIQVVFKAVNHQGNNFFLDNVEVTYANEIVVRSLELTNEICGGDGSGKIEVDASFNSTDIFYAINGGSFVSSGVFEGLVSGNHQIEIQGGGSSKELSIEVSAESQPPAKPFIIFASEKLKLLTNEAEIEWYYNDHLIEDSGVNTIDFAGPGAYHVIVRNFNGCERTSYPFVILKTDDVLDGVSIYPNPVSKYLHIEVGNQTEKVMIKDLAGKEWISLEGSMEQAIPVSHLPSGIYLVSVTSLGGTRTTKIFKN